MREGYEGGVRGCMELCSVPNAPMGHPAKRIIIELAIFRDLSGDDASVSVEKSNHASSQAMSKVFIQIITVYHY